MAPKSFIIRIVIILLAVVSISFLLISGFYKTTISQRMFKSINEFDGIREYVKQEIPFNSLIEPESDNIAARWAYKLIFEEQDYDVYAYEFFSTSYSKTFFCKKTERDSFQNYNMRLNYADEEPYICFFENRLIMIYYYDAQYTDLVNFINHINQYFTIDLDKDESDV